MALFLFTMSTIHNENGENLKPSILVTSWKGIRKAVREERRQCHRVWPDHILQMSHRSTIQHKIRITGTAYDPHYELKEVIGQRVGVILERIIGTSVQLSVVRRLMDEYEDFEGPVVQAVTRTKRQTIEAPTEDFSTTTNTDVGNCLLFEDSRYFGESRLKIRAVAS
ncbi:hypothetical protein K435DRAFT_839690 [Dendrothele bispora CBS 962.96]|uniref:Uncharacterized protein n=1 Tax=Dendrothele bispora (strain CBS 962.96) TaxID=1314807 RepID=A0A4S8M009_DENBC|nr:hypothetical protein K435DRAFT_839690 [Dendrothele bispora CBS 962.96]